MKKSFRTSLAALYLLGLWTYQLPVSPVERALMKVFRPIQRVTFTDRQYRMYAPDPRAHKKIPFLLLRTDRSPARFFKRHFSIFSAEKWTGFLDHLAKSLLGEWTDYPPEEGRAVFEKLAQRICRDESTEDDRVRSVSLQYRTVHFEEFREDIVWDSPETLETYGCN